MRERILECDLQSWIHVEYHNDNHINFIKSKGIEDEG